MARKVTVSAVLVMTVILSSLVTIVGVGAAAAEASIDVFAGGSGSGGALDVAIGAPRIAVVDGDLLVSGAWTLRRVDLGTGSQTPIAGNGVPVSAGDGGPAASAMLARSGPVEVTPDGAVLISDHARLRRIDPDGTIDTILGSGLQASAGDGGPAVDATVFGIEGIAAGADGSIFVSDLHRVRRIGQDGIITTVAGTGTGGFGGDGGVATAAQLDSPAEIDVDSDGNLYIADTGNHRIRRVDAGTGVITTVAGTGNPGFSGDGGPAVAADLDLPSAVAVVDDGTVLVADTFNNRVRAIAPAGTISTVAGNDGGGFYYDGGPVGWTTLWRPDDLALDEAGNVYIGDNRNRRVRRLDSDGRVTTVAGNGSGAISGDGGPALGAQIGSNTGSAVRDGEVLIANPSEGLVRRVAADGRIDRVAGNGDYFSELGDGGPATQANVAMAWDVAWDGAGGFYVTQRSDGRIRHVAADGTITTIAGTGELGYSGDGSLATSAMLNFPTEIIVLPDESVVVADSGNMRLRRIDADTGLITTIAGNGSDEITGDGGPAVHAGVGQVQDIAVDEAGRIYLVTEARVRRIDVAGVITTIAGGGEESWQWAEPGSPATSVSLWSLSSVAPDGLGNLYVSSYTAIIRIDVAGRAWPFAGDLSVGYAGDGGPASEARFYFISDLAIRQVGDDIDLLVTAASQRIRAIRLAVISDDESPSPSESPTVTEEPAPSPGGDGASEPSPVGVSRLSGADRLETAIEVSRAGYGDNEAQAVVLAFAGGYADALAAGPLAAHVGGPILLTYGDSLDSRVEDEIVRALGPGGKVYVVGGAAVIGESVESRLEQVGLPHVRVAGVNRYATAAKIAALLPEPGAIFLASGHGYADGLAAGPAAVAAGGVIVLTADASLPPETAAFLDDHDTVPRFAVGGAASRAMPSATATATRRRPHWRSASLARRSRPSRWRVAEPFRTR